jgi:hypothetical protein
VPVPDTHVILAFHIFHVPQSTLDLHPHFVAAPIPPPGLAGLHAGNAFEFLAFESGISRTIVVSHCVPNTLQSKLLTAFNVRPCGTLILHRSPPSTALDGLSIVD